MINCEKNKSQFIFNDGKIKGRLLYKGINPISHKPYYYGQWKYVSDINELGEKNYTFYDDEKYNRVNNWATYICGDEEWLNLTEQEKQWAIIK